MPKRILLIGGSLNQTTMVQHVARYLTDYECWFSPYYADGLLQHAAAGGWLDFTVLGGQARRRTLQYLGGQGLNIDDRGLLQRYDLVVMTSDLVVPRNVRETPIVLVQEGMTDPENYRYHLVRRLGLPRYLGNTSMVGLSHVYVAFCVASEGYRDLFVRKGVRPDRIRVTGIPNFDNVAAFLDNDFPHRGHVLAATSCLRETLKYEDRAAFIRKARRLADGRRLLFKLHPNERVGRATREIQRLAPDAVVFADGNTNHMIANADMLVTRYSSVVYIGFALGKDVHADIDDDTLRRLAPIQNGGTSARRIADVCKAYLQ